MKANLILATMILTGMASAQAFAWGNRGEWIPGLDRYVRLQKSAAQKEYSPNYEDLIEPIMRLATRVDGARCKEWRKATKQGDGELPVSFFNEGTVTLQLQLLKLNAQAIANVAGAGWTDVGSAAITNVKIVPEWDNDATTVLAGRQVVYAVEQDLQRGANSYQAREAMKSSGVAELKITNAAFACDLYEKRVTFKVQAEVSQNAAFSVPAKLKTADVVELSRRLQKAGDLGSGREGVFATESLRAINAAGFAGYQMQQLGYGVEIFKNGEFLSLVTKIFENGSSRPLVLNQMDAQNFVKSMARTNYDPQTFKVDQDLTLILE